MVDLTACVCHSCSVPYLAKQTVWGKAIVSVRDKIVGNSSMVKGTDTELFKLARQVTYGFEMHIIMYIV